MVGALCLVGCLVGSACSQVQFIFFGFFTADIYAFPPLFGNLRKEGSWWNEILTILSAIHRVVEEEPNLLSVGAQECLLPEPLYLYCWLMECKSAEKNHGKVRKLSQDSFREDYPVNLLF